MSVIPVHVVAFGVILFQKSKFVGRVSAISAVSIDNNGAAEANF